MSGRLSVATQLLRRFATLGVDVTRLLRLAGLPASRFAGARALLTTREYFALWHALPDAGAAPDFGLRLGSEPATEQLDVAHLAALCAPTFGAALTTLRRYKRLCAGPGLWFEIVGRELHVASTWDDSDETPPPLMADASLASKLALARRGTGTLLTPLRIELARRRGRDEPILRRHFGCPTRFDAPGDTIVFAATTAALPFTTDNAELAATLLPGLEAAMKARGARTLADEVRAALARRMRGERPSVAKIASDLALTARTLQRRLRDEGLSYQALLDGVRHTAARRLLSETALELGEVAFLLGFEELNSFARAFHGWEQTTPARWRAKSMQRAEPTQRRQRARG